MILGMLQAAAGSYGGGTSRDYVVFDFVDSTTSNLRGGTIDISTGASTEDFAFNIFNASTSLFRVNRTDVCRLNGYIGYQTIYGFFIFDESGNFVGSKPGSGSILRSNIGTDMCVCGNFIVGIEPTAATTFKVWKFDTTSEVFTEIRSTTAGGNLHVFGVAQLTADTIGLTYYNSTPSDVIERIDINTGTRTTLFTGTHVINTSFPHPLRVYRIDDDHYLRTIRTSITNLNIQVVDYATSTVQQTAFATVVIGTTTKVAEGVRFARGENSEYMLLGANNFNSNNFVSILSKDFSANPFRAYHGTIGTDSTYDYGTGTGSYSVNINGTAYIYNDLVIATTGKVLDPLRFREIDQINRAGTIQSLYVSEPSL